MVEILILSELLSKDDFFIVITIKGTEILILYEISPKNYLFIVISKKFILLEMLILRELLSKNNFFIVITIKGLVTKKVILPKILIVFETL